MADIATIIKQADELGRLIAQHDATRRYDQAIQALEKDTDAQRALTDLNRHIEMLAEKESQGKPIEVADKRKLESLQSAVIASKTLRDVQVAQMDYVDLMRQVDDAMSKHTPQADAPPPAG